MKNKNKKAIKQKNKVQKQKQKTVFLPGLEVSRPVSRPNFCGLGLGLGFHVKSRSRVSNP